jgi:hypothetical protein
MAKELRQRIESKTNSSKPIDNIGRLNDSSATEKIAVENLDFRYLLSTCINVVARIRQHFIASDGSTCRINRVYQLFRKQPEYVVGKLANGSESSLKLAALAWTGSS